MPKKAKELSALAVSKLKAEGRHAVGGADGLYLRIAGESRAWVLCVAFGTRTNRSGKEVVRRLNMGLGPFPEVSLAEAREKARELRKQVRKGIDPLQEKREAKARDAKQAAKSKTFSECALAFIEDKRGEWKNEKHAAQWRSTLETYAFPKIGALPIAAIDTDLVLQVLRQEVPTKVGGTAQLWHAKNETASRLRGRIESVLDWAKVSKYREGENPAAWQGNLKHALPAPGKVQKVEHHAALPYVELGAFMAELRKREGMSARALEFAILTAARSGEVRGATWTEIDLQAKTWTIPASRMKAEKEHEVPLSDAAVKLLKALPRIVGNDCVFPAPRGGQLSDMSLTAVLKRMERGGLTQHGFRSTFRDWAGETTNHPREVIEHALAHQLKDKAERAYQRGTLWPKRVHLMADWANYCGQVAASNVVELKQEAA
ncbi:MAG: integrase arm-type DNA-binding domain-containing protein [Sideroxyarcus sp.]